MERGAEGNERLTAAAAAVLFLLLAAEGLTLVSIHRLLPEHVFLGMLLVPPVLVKLASTGWRFARYYSGAEPYRRKGPPLPLLRLLGPVLVLSTVVMFASGIALVTTSVLRGPMLLLHKASFVLWFAVTTVHVLAYLWRVPRLAAADWQRRSRLRGSGGRRAAVALSLVAGVALAAATVHLAGNWPPFFGG